jgi:ABC-2 type transport system permease protein
MSGIRLFFVAGVLSYRALFRWLTPSAFIPSVIGTPVFQLVWFVYLGSYVATRPISYYAVGNAIHACALAGLFAPSMAIAMERAGGTLVGVLATPANRAAMFIGRTVPAALTGFLISGLLFAGGALFVHLSVPVAVLPHLGLAMLVTATSCSAFGLILGAVGLRMRDATFLANVTLYVLLLVGGVNIPLSQLPPVLRVLGNLLPMTHGIAASRAALAGAESLRLVAIEATKAAAYLGIAVLVLALLERGARRNGSLEIA